MIVNGRLIADNILSGLEKKVARLAQNKIIPGLAIVLIGNDKLSQLYMRQKEKAATLLKIKCRKYTLDKKISINKFTKLIDKLNNDNQVHGIIIQRPVPISLSIHSLNSLITPNKDIDGFHPQSLFDPPVALAVVCLLQWVNKDICSNPLSPVKEKYCQPFWQWFKKQKILLIGRGATAGKPIAKYLMKKNINFQIAHSQTTDLKQICLSSNIIISCVGKPNNVRQDMVTNNTILIGVGLHSEKEKLQADYDQGEITKKAAYFTPVPGGVGPVNVACLMENLIRSAMKKKEVL